MKEKDIGRQYINNLKIAYKIRSMRFLSGKNASKPYENPLSNFDMDVADSIYTIFRNRYIFNNAVGDEIGFTTADILHVLSGNFNQRLTAGLKKAIEKSIETMRHTDIEIFMGKNPNPRFILYAHDENDEVTSVPEKYQFNMYYRRPFLQLEGKNGNYKIKINSFLEDYVLISILPLYGYAYRRNYQFIELDPILLSYETDTQTKDSPKASRRHQRTMLYIQIRRELIRRIEWSRYHSKKEIYSGRDISKGADGQYVSHEKSIPTYGHGKIAGRARIIYLRMPHRSDAGIKKQGGTGLLPQLGFLPGAQVKSSGWRERKRSAHHNVCLILNTFKEMNYIDGYRNIMAPAPYRKRGSSDVPAPVFHYSKTQLEQKRLENGMGRAAFCKLTMNWPDSDQVKDVKGMKNRLVDRLQQYEWKESNETFTEEEWQRFSETLGYPVEDLKEPLSNLETARIKCRLSREELAAKLVNKDITDGYFGEYKTKEAGELLYQADQTDQSIADWLELIEGSEKIKATSFLERYNYHLDFIRNAESPTDLPAKVTESKNKDRGTELSRIAGVLNACSTDKTNPIDKYSLQRKRKNLTIYGVEIYGVATPSEWNQQLKKL